MKIKNVSGTDLTVPWLGGRLVVDEQEVPVPEGKVFAFTQQEQTWAPADDEAQAEHDEGLQACLYVLQVEGRLVEAPEAAVAVTGAKALIADLASATYEQAADLLDAERERDTPRITVVAAAEKRIAELEATDDVDTDDQAGTAGETNTGNAGDGDVIS